MVAPRHSAHPQADACLKQTAIGDRTFEQRGEQHAAGNACDCSLARPQQPVALQRPEAMSCRSWDSIGTGCTRRLLLIMGRPRGRCILSGIQGDTATLTALLCRSHTCICTAYDFWAFHSGSCAPACCLSAVATSRNGCCYAERVQRSICAPLASCSVMQNELQNEFLGAAGHVQHQPGHPVTLGFQAV